jgi:hypothetical protein
MLVAALLAPGLSLAAEIRSVSLAGDRWLERLLSRGDGGGADVEGPLVVIQTDYSDAENGNAALLFWSERSGNPAGISVFVDGAFLGTLSAPGLVFVTALDPGLRTFRIEEAGVAAPTAAEGSLTILDAQPFGDASDLRRGRSAGGGRRLRAVHRVDERFPATGVLPGAHRRGALGVDTGRRRAKLADLRCRERGI